MAEVPITQTLETIRTHEDFDEESALAGLLAVADILRKEARSGGRHHKTSLQKNVRDTETAFDAVWNFPRDLRKTDWITHEPLNPNELLIKRFALHIGGGAVSMVLQHDAAQRTAPSAEASSVASFTTVGFTVGYNPTPEHMPFRYSEGANDDEDGGRGYGEPLPPRPSLYTSLELRDTIGRPHLDLLKDPSIEEFAELFAQIPAKAGLHAQALSRAPQPLVIVSEVLTPARTESALAA